MAARRGLQAVGLILPHLAALRPALEPLFARPEGATPGEIGLAVIMDGLRGLAPMLEPDAFLEIAAAMTGIPPEILEKARFADVLSVTMAGLAELDLPTILASANKLFSEAGG